MPRSIVTININNELDVVLAYKRAMQLSERIGIALANQTKFATAVSEICRNVVEYVGSGTIQFNVAEEQGVNFLEAIISDRGRGIANLEHILSRPSYESSNRGSGLLNSKKLVDYFQVDSSFERGTSVTLRKRIPGNVAPLTKAVLVNWLREFDKEADISPYAEIKKQNMQLLELLEELRIRNLEAEQQLQEIKRLNGQMQLSNVEIGQLLSEREKKNEQLQKINEDLDAFAHTVSHDLRAPLQNINGLTTALEACLDSGNTEEARTIFPIIRNQTHKMDRLITGILAYSLAGHHSLRKQIVDLQIVLHQVVTSLNIPGSFNLIIQPSMPVLYSQEIYLYQVFSNLIGNAIKHHDQPEQATIQIQFKKQPDHLLFSVQDNGPGIRKANQEMIFTKFETLGQNMLRTDSMGLGLAIVQKIVQEKGGNIWIESEDRGTRFNFTWPLAELVKEDQDV